MRAEGGARIGWSDVPEHVRSAVDAALGSPIVATRDQPGGFSPGVAARARLADGTGAFLKAVSPAQNPQACRIQRREAEVAGLLPPTVPAPRVRHLHDDGTWVVLVLDLVDGHQPDEPWRPGELARVLDAIGRFHADHDPIVVEGLQSAQARHGAVFDGWRRLAAGDGDPGAYGPDVAAAVPALAGIEATWADAAAGRALLHADLRADNLLLGDDVGPGRGVTLVDWPWACTGAPVLDLAMFLPSVGLGGGPGIAEVVEAHHLLTGPGPGGRTRPGAHDRDAFRAVLAAVAGFFVRHSLDPAPPGLPRLRAFQRAQAEVALAWLLPRVSRPGC